MEFMELLEKCEEVRRRSECRDETPDYSYSQFYLRNGKKVSVRTRVAELRLYPENNNHMRVLREINDLNYTYACILHDRDLLDSITDNSSEDSLGDVFSDDNLLNDDEQGIIENSDNNIYFENSSLDGIHKKPHIHCVLSFMDPRTNTAVAKQLRMGSNLVTMHHRLDTRLAYLTHIDHRDKYQYSPYDVVGNMANRIPSLQFLRTQRKEDILASVLKRVKKTDSRQIVHITDLTLYMIDNGMECVVKNSGFMQIIRTAVIEHNEYARWLNKEGFKRVNSYDDVPFKRL